MKRFHGHAIFGAAPSVLREDYAKSDKYWITDPQGIAWETFHTLESIPVFGDEEVQPTPTVCCIPLAHVKREHAQDAAPCCVPTRTDQAASGSCC